MLAFDEGCLSMCVCVCRGEECFEMKAQRDSQRGEAETAGGARSALAPGLKEEERVFFVSTDQ